MNVPLLIDPAFFWFTMTEQRISDLWELRKHIERENRLAFPRIFACLICARHLKAETHGTFQCPFCRTVLDLTRTGEGLLG